MNRVSSKRLNLMVPGIGFWLVIVVIVLDKSKGAFTKTALKSEAIKWLHFLEGM